VCSKSYHIIFVRMKIHDASDHEREKIQHKILVSPSYLFLFFFKLHVVQKLCYYNMINVLGVHYTHLQRLMDYIHAGADPLRVGKMGISLPQTLQCNVMLFFSLYILFLFSVYSVYARFHFSVNRVRCTKTIFWQIF